MYKLCVCSSLSWIFYALVKLNLFVDHPKGQLHIRLFLKHTIFVINMKNYNYLQERDLPVDNFLKTFSATVNSLIILEHNILMTVDQLNSEGFLFLHSSNK